MTEVPPDQWARSLLGATVGGRYKLASLLGMGGMGAVFDAVHVAIERRVAVKLLMPELLNTREVVERFNQEARAAAGIKRRGVVDVLDFGVDAQHGAFLVMEHLEGEPFSRLLARAAPLSPPDAARILAAVLDTLSAVHQRGIVHRDLKPGNVFMARTEEGEEIVKVLDFGISRMAPPPGRSAITLPGTVLGTPRYMAPEQAMGAPDVDARADLYSAGAMLYSSLGGRQPYSEFRPDQVLIKMLEGGPAPLRTVRPGLPEALYAVVDRAMARERKDRFQTAAEMLAALRAAVPNALPTPQGGEPGRATPTPAPAPALAAGATQAHTAPGIQPAGARTSLTPTPAARPSLSAPTPTGYAPMPGPPSGGVPRASVPTPMPAPMPTPTPMPTPVGPAGAWHPAPVQPATMRATPYAPPAPAQPPRRVWPWVLAAGALVLVAAGGVYAGLQYGRSGADSPAGVAFPGAPPTSAPRAGDADPAIVRNYQARLDAALSTAMRGDYGGARAQLTSLRAEMAAVTGPRGEAYNRVLGNTIIALGSARAQQVVLPPANSLNALVEVETGYADVANLYGDALRLSLNDVTQCGLVGMGRGAEQVENIFSAMASRPVVDPNESIAFTQTLSGTRGRYYDMAVGYYNQALAMPAPNDPRCAAEARAGLDRVTAARATFVH